MAKRKPPEDTSPRTPAWMTSYSDLVSLLFVFFLLLFTMSNLDESKFAEVSNVFSGNLNPPLNIPNGLGFNDLMGSGIMNMPILDQRLTDAIGRYENTQSNLEQLAEEIREYFESLSITGVEIHVGEQTIRFRFLEGLLFDSGRADIKPEAIEILRIIGEEVHQFPNSIMRIEGHTDNRPINTVVFPNNWFLSSARASSVSTFFADRVGLDPMRLQPIGYGEFHPIETNDTAEGRAQNRRVELYIMTEFYKSDLSVDMD